jgi:hypothetical protein
MPLALPKRAIFKWLIFSALLAGILIYIKPMLENEFHTALGLVGLGVLMILFARILGLQKIFLSGQT